MSSLSNTATRVARFLGASACAVALAAGAAGTAAAQQAPLAADLVGSARACTFNGSPLLAEGAPICGAELRIRPDEVRFEAETARALPGGRAEPNAIAFQPRGKPGCVDAQALPPDPVTYNCTRPASDPLYSQCVVEIGVAQGDNGLLNEAACLLRRPITFQVRDRAGVVKFTQNANVVECLADPASRNPRADAAAGEPVNVCTVGVGLRAGGRHALAAATNGWRVRVTQNVTSPVVPNVTSPFTATLQESLF